MRYLLVDRITAWKADESIDGIKNVAMTEDFLEFHFPGNPVMPGALTLEALVQMAGWLEAASSQFRHWFVLSKVHKCHFYGFILPGDQIRLEVRLVEDAAPGERKYQGTALVEGKKKIKVTFAGERLPLTDIEDLAEQQRMFRILTREIATPS